jgi:DNA polymerase-1
MAAPKKLFLVDAMGHVYRAFFAPMERLRSPSGLPTKVPYVFANILRRLLKDYQPDYLGIVFDTKAPTFRDKLFERYKAQRPPMPDDLSAQLPFVRRLCEAMRLPIVEMDGYEADDLIGALAQQAARRRLDVYLVTNDKDMMQLVGEGIRILRTGPGGAKGDTLVEEARVRELLGVPPEKVIDVMALMGDPIDNIPGAKGIGEKGAVELIQRFGSVEGALDHAAEVPNKRYREALQQQREQVLLSKQLATIASGAPIELDLQALERREPDPAALAALYRELGFTSLLKELGAATSAAACAGGPVPAAGAAQKSDYAQLTSAEELRVWLGGVPRETPLAMWLTLFPGERATEGFGAKIASLEVSHRAGTGRSIWLDEKGQALHLLAPRLADSGSPKIVHDPKLFHLLAGPVAGIRDAMVLYSYLLRPTTANHAFADVVLRYLNIAPAGLPGEHADLLQRLAPVLRQEVEAQDLAAVYEKIDLPLAPVLAGMERVGVRVDPQALAEMSGFLEAEIRGIEGEIWRLAGCEFNVNSPQQLAEILFNKLGLEPPSRRGRSKGRSTAADILEELGLVHELPRKVIEYREIAKLKSTYVDALPKLIHAGSGRLHTSLSQTGTATGRLSSSEPNLQNIPVRTELGRRIRAAFVAGEGKLLLSADYSQIELRILAHFSGDPVLVEAFRRGEDIHARTAQEVFGVGPLAQTAEQRRAAKVINFGIIYGLSAFGLAQQLGIEQKEAARFIQAYFERYRGVKEYLDHSLEETRRCGFTRTLFGRVRPIPEIQSAQASLRNFAERTALNTPLQGTAADLIKLAMIAIDRRLGDAGLQTKMILQVHDELLFEVPRAELGTVKALVRREMENVHRLHVPLLVEVKFGPNWRDIR